MRCFRSFLIGVIAVFSIGYAPARATCASPLPSGPLPIQIGEIEVSTLPTTGSTFGSPAIIRFNGSQIIIKQSETTEAIEVTFQTGSVGPVKASQRDKGGNILLTDILPTQGSPGTQVTFRYFTHGAQEVIFESLNNEGAITNICEAKRISQ